MKIQHLSEGVIKVPPPLLKNYYKHLLRVISTTIIQSIYRGEFLTDSDIDIYNEYGIEFKDYGDNYNIANTDGKRLTSNITVNELNFPYGKVDRDITIQFQFDNDLTHSNGYYRAIDDDKGTVVISLHDIVQKAFRTISIDSFYEDDEDLLSNLKSGIFPMEFNMTLLPLVKKAMNVIEHELAHAIQHLVIKHEDQLKLNKGYNQGSNDEYWKSPVEFSPQIISAARNIETYIETLEIMNSSKRMEVMLYAIGEKTFDQLNIGTNSDINILDNSRQFFKTLKNKKPKAFKKAVNTLYTELKKNDVIK